MRTHLPIREIVDRGSLISVSEPAYETADVPSIRHVHD